MLTTVVASAIEQELKHKWLGSQRCREDKISSCWVGVFVFDIVLHIRRGNAQGGEDTVLLKTYFNLPLRRNVAPRPWRADREAGNRGVVCMDNTSDALQTTNVDGVTQEGRQRKGIDASC